MIQGPNKQMVNVPAEPSAEIEFQFLRSAQLVVPINVMHGVTAVTSVSIERASPPVLAFMRLYEVSIYVIYRNYGMLPFLSVFAANIPDSARVKSVRDKLGGGLVVLLGGMLCNEKKPPVTYTCSTTISSVPLLCTPLLSQLSQDYNINFTLFYVSHHSTIYNHTCRGVESLQFYTLALYHKAPARTVTLSARTVVLDP